MPDTLTRPVADQQPTESGPRGLNKGRFVILGLLIGVQAGFALFAALRGPSRAELEQARWEQVVDYYSEQYQVMADTQAEIEAAHWDEVINHYARQYELMQNAQSGSPTSELENAHWEAVVDYYEQQWELRAK
jgi:hypothetical protein